MSSTPSNSCKELAGITKDQWSAILDLMPESLLPLVKEIIEPDDAEIVYDCVLNGCGEDVPCVEECKCECTYCLRNRDTDDDSCCECEEHADDGCECDCHSADEEED